MAKKDQSKENSANNQAENSQAAEIGEPKAEQLGATMGLDVTAEEVGSQKSEGENATSDLRPPIADAAAVSAAPHDEPDAEAPVNSTVNGSPANLYAGQDFPLATSTSHQHSPSSPTPRPSCSRHHVQMRAVSSPEHVTYYACPVPGCDQTDKRSRKAAAIPTEPKACPMRTCQASGEPGSHPQYLEVDERKTKGNPALIVLVCPQCGFELKTPRPGVFDRVQRIREREASDDYAAR